MTSDYLEAATRRRVEAELDALGDELEGTFSAETVERYVAESIAGLSDARTKTYLPIFVGRFARDRLRALGQSQGVIVREVPVVPLLCVHISGRSAAARVLLDHYAHGTVEVRSAGWEPGDQLNPAVVAVLIERGLDATKEFPSRSPTRSPVPRMSSSRWAAATPARSTPASATSTGSSKTRRASPSRRSGPSSTTSTEGSRPS